MDQFDLLEVQGTLKNLFQQHSSKALILWCSAFFIVQLSYPYMLSSIQLLSCVWLFVTLWTTARQASLSITNSRSPPKPDVSQVGDAIQPSHPLLSPSPPALNLSQHQGLFKWVSSSHEVAKVLESQLQHLSFQWTPTPALGWTGWISLQSKGLSRVSNTIIQKHQFFSAQLSTGKTIALTRWTFFSKVMPLLFNMLSRLIIAFLPRSRHLLILWLQSPSTVILEPKKIKSLTVSIVSPSICHGVMGPDAMMLVFWMLSFKLAFSVFFHFHQEAV